MFLIDKYTPKHVDDVFFHKEIYDLLKKMARDDSIPHIIFHGMPGTGKKTMINIFLELLFDSTVRDTYEVTYKVTSSSNKTNNEIIKKSDYHIVIQPKNTNYDRYLIHNVVKDYAKRTGFQAYRSKRAFKIIQIDNLDDFTFYAQTSLRRTIENYSDKCRFIMWCNSLSNVIRPIQSRCTCIKLPCPTEEQMLDFICYISAMEKRPIPLDIMHKIIKASDGHIKDALWKVQSHWIGIGWETDYDREIKSLVKYILSGSMDNINTIREKIYRLCITNFTHNKILRDMVDVLMNTPELRDDVKIKIIVKVAELEYNMIRGRRAIFHFDAIIAAIISIVHNSGNLIEYVESDNEEDIKPIKGKAKKKTAVKKKKSNKVKVTKGSKFTGSKFAMMSSTS